MFIFHQAMFDYQRLFILVNPIRSPFFYGFPVVFGTYISYNHYTQPTRHPHRVTVLQPCLQLRAHAAFRFHTALCRNLRRLLGLTLQVAIKLTGWWLSPAPLKNMGSSIGMMTFTIYGKKHVPNHQPDKAFPYQFHTFNTKN